MERKASIEIPGEILVDIIRFFNRSEISNSALANRRFRDISQSHFSQYPIFLLPRLQNVDNIRNTTSGEYELGLEIRFHDYRKKDCSVPLNSPLLSNSPPAYLRFKRVDIYSYDLFEEYSEDLNFNVRKLLDILKRLQSAFVDSKMHFNSGPRLGEPFTTRRSLLQFLKVDILPLFPSCREYTFFGLNMEGLEENEIEREPLLLLPQLYNSESRIALDFTFHTYLGSEDSEKNTFAIPMISIQEVITWLHRPNPEDPSKKRELHLGDDVFSYDHSLTAIAIKEIKRRLLEIFVSATQRCSYVLDVQLVGCGSWVALPELKENSVVLNDNTGEQLKIYAHEGIISSGPYLFFKRTRQSVSS